MELVCTLNDPDQAKRVYDLGVRNVKIASGQVCLDMLKSVTEIEGWRRLFISTGMQGDSGLSTMYFDFEEQLKDKGIVEEVVLMHCVSLYPPMDTEVNLLRIETIAKKFSLGDHFTVGYSDHRPSGCILACVLAAGIGAEYIELHVHEDGDYSPVHAISKTYDQVEELREALDVTDMIMGDGEINSQEREDDVYEKYKGRWVW
jgi:sialic acid synthase SpsE